MSQVEFKSVTKIYDKKKIIDNVSLTVNDKEFLVLVGSSGCGKSTLLRMIAGLEEITDGEIFIDGKCVNNVHPKDRDIAFVFQNYALYPHMSVYENMAFPLKMRKMSKKDIDLKVKEAAEILDLTELLQRKPKQLSGGQRQRVALGRAIVRNPKVFLMDEPLSNLDAKLRVQMRAEIKKLHQKLQTTFIYVTHDQTEALTMGDRIAVIDAGVIQQIGTPLEVYNNPVNKFVGGFLGSPSMNFILSAVIDSTVSLNGTKIELKEEQIKSIAGRKEVLVAIRPEKFNSENCNIEIKAQVEISEMLGNSQIVYFKINDSECSASVSSDVKVEREITLKFNSDDLMFFDTETTDRLV
ncbi:MAG: sn-glycerol-3-phosphate ABC transporter ATP-binding protein UgpC [Candidatus Gastranaerophilales bacterium]|nr:sn-glycerol-3-phosphate ABC transporter ATP-binding protein UgpC [Candidatus Gastranaerophilales bacterium]